MADELVFRLTVDDNASAKIGAFERKLKGLQEESESMSRKMQTAFSNVGGYITDFAVDAAKAFGKFSVDSVNQFTKFETAMVAVAKTTGIPKEALGKFSEQIRETAIDLKGLGKDAAIQIAGVAEVAGQLGIGAEKLGKGQFDAASTEILNFAEVVAKAKIALPEFRGGVEQIATVIAKQINLYGEQSTAAEQYLSVMNKLSDTTAATAVEISSFLGKFTIAPTLKITQEQAASWGATYVSLGQNASDAATRMQSALAMMLKGSEDTNGALTNLFASNQRQAKALEDLAGRQVHVMENGQVAVEDYSNLVREAIGKDANEAIKLLVTTLSEVESESVKSEIAFKAFGQVGARALLTLIPQLPKLSDAAKEATTVFLSTNDEALASLEKMSGVSRQKFGDVADFMKAVFATDTPDAIRVAIREIEKIDDEAEKARVASEIFGEDWEVAMNKAKGGVELFDEALKTAQAEIEATKNGASSIEKEYNTALDQVKTKFSELTAITEDIKLQWGAPLAQALSDGLSIVTPVLEEIRVNGIGVADEFGKAFGVDALGGAFKDTLDAFTGTLSEMATNSATFTAELKEMFSMPALFESAKNQWTNFALWVGEGSVNLSNEILSALGEDKFSQAFGAILSAYTGTLKEMSENSDIFIAELKQAFSLPELFKSAWEQWTAFSLFVGEGAAKLAATVRNAFNANAEQDAANVMQQQANNLEEANRRAAESTEQLTKAMEGQTAEQRVQSDSAKNAIDALVSIKNANVEVLSSNKELRDEYRAVATAMGEVASGGVEPTQALVESTARLATQLKAAGVDTTDLTGRINELGKATMGADYALEGGSLTPALRRYISAALDSSKTTGGLTAEMTATMQSVLQADDAYTALEKTMTQNRVALLENQKALQEQRALRLQAGDEEKKVIDATINALQIKRTQLQIENSSIKEKMTLVREEIDLNAESVKRYKEDADARSKALQEEEKQIDSVAKTRQKAIDEEAKRREKIAREIQKEHESQMKAAEDSLKWIGNIDEAAQKRLFAERDIVATLERQGVTLNSYQRDALDRMKSEFQTEEALKKQAAALQAQLDPMGALVSASNELGDNFGKLSSGVKSIGELFGIDTSGIEKFLGKAQQIAALPQQLSGVLESIKGIGGALSSVFGAAGGEGGGLMSALSGLFSGGGAGAAGASSAVSGLAASLGPLAALAAGAAVGWKALDGEFGKTAKNIAEFTLPAFSALKKALEGDWTGALKSLFPFANAVSKLFEDTKSKGTEAANVFQNFIAKNVEGGAQLEAALKTNFDAMSAAGFNFSTFLTETGTTFDQTFGGLSAKWQEGTTAMDLFTQAIVASGVEVEKAPQQALMMMAAFQDMGLSAEQASAKMLEIAKAAGMSEEQLAQLKLALEGSTAATQASAAATQEAATANDTFAVSNEWVASALSTLSAEGGYTAQQMQSISAALSSAAADGSVTASEMEALQKAFADMGIGGDKAKAMIDLLKKSLTEIPTEVNVKVNVQTTGEVPKLASGGVVDSGLAIVNERGAEIAKFRSGAMALMTTPGPVLGAFPSGTEIIPHTRSMNILRDYPNLPRMATGGIISAAATAPIINVTITGNNITPETNLKALAKQVSAEISREYNARR